MAVTQADTPRVALEPAPRIADPTGAIAVATADRLGRRCRRGARDRPRLAPSRVSRAMGHRRDERGSTPSASGRSRTARRARSSCTS